MINDSATSNTQPQMATIENPHTQGLLNATKNGKTYGRKRTRFIMNDGTKGIFPVGVVGTIYGDGGTGKTHLGEYLAGNIINGSSFGMFNGGYFAGRPTKVLLATNEDDPEEVMGNIEAYSSNLDYVDILEMPSLLDFTDPEKQDAFAEYICKMQSEVFIALDSLSTIVPDGRDKDNNGDTRAILGGLNSAMRKVRKLRELPLTVYLVGHTTKSGNGDGGKDLSGAADWINSPRGSYRIVNDNTDLQPDGIPVQYLKIVKANTKMASRETYQIITKPYEYSAKDDYGELGQVYDHIITELQRSTVSQDAIINKNKKLYNNSYGQDNDAEIKHWEETIYSIMNGAKRPETLIGLINSCNGSNRNNKNTPMVMKAIMNIGNDKENYPSFGQFIYQHLPKPKTR
jgi:hypothetical protein